VYETHKASVLSYSQTITAPWFYFAHDFLSNQRSNVRSRTNRIFSRIVFLERKLGVSVFSSLFMWSGILPVKNDSEWQSGFEEFLSSFFIDRKLLLFPFLLLFNLWLGILLSFLLFLSLFSFFSLFFFLSISSFSFFSLFPPHPFLREIGLSILFAPPRGDSVVLCFGGKEWGFPFLQAKVQKGLRLCFNRVFYRGNPILISGAKQIWVSRCRSRAELPHYSIRHAWQWWFGNNVQN